MRNIAFALFGLAAALTLAAIWIHLSSLRITDGSNGVPFMDAAIARRVANVQILVQAAGGALVLGLILHFGRREPAGPAATPAPETDPSQGPKLLIGGGIVLLGLLPWLTSRLHAIFRRLWASAPNLEDFPDTLEWIDAFLLPAAISAALPGLVLVTLGVVKRQGPRHSAPPTPARPANPSDLGTGGPWAMILAAIGAGVGTPVAARWQIAQLRDAFPDAEGVATVQRVVRFATTVAEVFALVLFLSGVALLRRVLSERRNP